MSTTIQQKKVREYNNTFEEKDIDKPWYSTMQSGWSLKQIRQTKGSRAVMKQFFKISEALGIVKKGVVETQCILYVLQQDSGFHESLSC